jgi:DNA-binding CsgD family transcriptional regulator
MDAANLTEKYILWSNILDLRSRGINIARTARRLGVSRNTVRHLQSLSLEEVLQHKERHYKLHAYEQAVASLLTSFPSISSSRIGDYLREHYPDFPHVGLLVELDGSYKKVHYLQRYNRA